MYYLIGNVKNSFSPTIHNTLFKLNNLKYAYKDYTNSLTP